jgi:hypothetical protein
MWRWAPAPVGSPPRGDNSDHGGKNGDELGCFDLIWLRFGGFSLEIHCHSALLYFQPLPLPSTPLLTTFDHILLLNAYMSTTKLQVMTDRFVSL